jgi:hypothetical protein
LISQSRGLGDVYKRQVLKSMQKLRLSEVRRLILKVSICLLASLIDLSIQQTPSFAFDGGTVVCTTGSFTFSGDTIYPDINRACTGSVIIPEGVVALGTDSFRDQAITSVQLPSTLTKIGSSALLGTSLTSINIPANVTIVEAQAFQAATQLRNVSIAGNSAVPTTLGLYVFNGDSLESLTLGVGEGLVQIRNRTLNSLIQASNLTLGKGLSLYFAQKVSDYPFIKPNEDNGTSVTTFNYYSTVPNTGPNAIVSNTGTGFDKLLPAFGLTSSSGVALAGVPFTSGYSILTTGLAATSYSISPTLGNGLSFSTSTGLITGTPNETSTVQSYQITGTNGNNFATANYSLAINSAIPSAPKSLSGLGGDGTATISFTQEIITNLPITNYKYSLNGSAYEILSPAITTSPVTIVGLSPGQGYTISLKAVNSQGESEASSTTSVTTIPSVSTQDVVIAAPVYGETPQSSITDNGQFSAAISWTGGSQVPLTNFDYSTIYTASVAIVPNSNHTLNGVRANFFTVNGNSALVGNTANNGSFTYTFPATADVVLPAPLSIPTPVPTPAPMPTPVPIPAPMPTPVPIPYLKTLTYPEIHLSSKKFVCIAGKYIFGYSLDGVIKGSETVLYKPVSYTFNLLFNQVAQTALSVTSAVNSATWDANVAPSGAVVSCSVTVTANSLTNSDASTANSESVFAALTTQSQSVAAAEIAYNAAVSANSKSYQKVLVDNRAAWRANVDKVKAAYLAELNRINGLPASKANSALKSAALKTYIADQKKTAADYKASGPDALAARDLANKAALDAKNAAIVKANSVYGTFIESIGYGVLTP